jgi:hypothetical protein
MLPIDGRVRVHTGQTVNPEVVIAEAALSPHVEVLDLRPIITGLTRREMQSMIEHEVGETVEAGDVIISTGGTLNRVLRATASGVIREITPTQVLLEVNRRPFQMRAAYHGDVVEIIPDRGVILQMRGVLVQGVWGNGQHASGKLVAVADRENQLLENDQLKADCVDAIVLAGRCNDIEVLRRVKNLPVRGLILGSLSSHLIPTVQQMEFPVLLINGFGPVGMDSQSFRLLRSNQGRKISAVALPWNRELGIRPEAHIHLPAEEIPAPPPPREYQEGQQVRVNTLPYLPQIGQIERIPPEPVLLPSGIKAMAADVLLKSGQRIVVPLLNLDVIE